MSEELKIRISGYKKVEENLISLGAKFVKEISVADTYFKQPKSEVLKVTEGDDGSFLVHLQSKNGKFEIVRNESLKDVENTKKMLSNRFGVKCVLKKKRRFFEFDNYGLNINLIEGVGEFLIVEGNNLSKKIIAEELRIPNPEFITVSFDELNNISI